MCNRKCHGRIALDVVYRAFAQISFVGGRTLFVGPLSHDDIGSICGALSSVPCKRDKIQVRGVTVGYGTVVHDASVNICTLKFVRCDGFWCGRAFDGRQCLHVLWSSRIVGKLYVFVRGAPVNSVFVEELGIGSFYGGLRVCERHP